MGHTTREIPKGQWADYLAQLSRQEHDHWVRVETISSDMGDQPLADRLPLIQISLESREAAEQGAVRIVVGRKDDEITHRILEPDHIYAEMSDGDGQLECLDIEGVDRSKTLVFFEPAAA